jgi:hypothetical protein
MHDAGGPEGQGAGWLPWGWFVPTWKHWCVRLRGVDSSAADATAGQECELQLGAVERDTKDDRADLIERIVHDPAAN